MQVTACTYKITVLKHVQNGSGLWVNELTQLILGGLILFCNVIWFYQRNMKNRKCRNPPNFLGKIRYKIPLTIEKQGNMQQQTEEHIVRSSSSKNATADLNLTRGDEFSISKTSILYESGIGLRCGLKFSLGNFIVIGGCS